MDELQHISKFDLEQLIRKDKETRKNLSLIDLREEGNNIQFGVDNTDPENPIYGYYPNGADTLTPFKCGGSDSPLENEFISEGRFTNFLSSEDVSTGTGNFSLKHLKPNSIYVLRIKATAKAQSLQSMTSNCMIGMLSTSSSESPYIMNYVIWTGSDIEDTTINRFNFRSSPVFTFDDSCLLYKL